MKFLKSAVHPEDYPPADRPELAITGRSNAGKSSLINAMGGSGQARVSKEPGKTRLLSFFDVGKHYRLVDMPGYGFSKRTVKEAKMWQTMIEAYLSLRGNLKGLILVMDIRRQWQEEEQMILSFVRQMGRPLIVVLNKQDKIKKAEIVKAQKALAAIKGVSKVFSVSCQTKEGVVELEEFLFQEIIKGAR